ncbi:NADH-quinone oxidoreductase subunit NuoH [Aestuariimicrobium sp. T2.26MG-19.2B]|uniref:NADH-quinone oxidoreductase subunit NuoH n=1 Tax=Aestuariimicrobium sp. T2.26MG-19.2B TaxID=3040679 RepID=UPI00247757F4|nr:NADH-quinone oxidoreductase subunit NuoH [Aestuariimicrobium sp. T2.26MG-19.2B]CAI9406043.1 NADH-quinone oxidoreductase subunit H [Aestuariimicrobium sp. T2.26MG-19.2B]
MNILENQIFGADPWWIVLIKVVMIFVLLLVWTIFNVWYERRVVAKMQHRLGPIMNGPFGLGQALADGAKLILKEDFRPTKTDRWIFNLAPLLTGTAAFTAWAVIPFGGEVRMFGHTTRLQLTDLPVAVLFVLAIASIGIYGIVLAGWASNSTYSLLGSIRSTAQMISYEVAMGLALVAVFMFSSSMSTSQIVEAQALPIRLGDFNTGIPGWYALLLFPSFIIYAISMVGETNRAPFDLPECESELVSGYLTEYSGFRYAMYFLAEYINMATVSAVATTLFLGGYRAPWPFNQIAFLDSGWFGVLWFVIKVQLLITVFVWLRGTLPRFRYDQFMHLGWKWLIPISLVWIVAISLLRAGQNEGWFQGPVFFVVLGVIIVGLLAFILFGGRKDDEPEGVSEVSEGDFDAFAGGYPVPPMPGQKLPELVSVVPSTLAYPDDNPADERAATTNGADS